MATLPADLDFALLPQATPARMNRAMAALDGRLRALELPARTLDQVLASIQQVGLGRINDALQPYYTALTDIVSLGLLFQASSATSAPIQTGSLVLTVDEEDQERFAPTGYLLVVSAADSGNAMLARTVSYARDTGLLTLSVQLVSGSGTHADWTIFPAVPPNVVAAIIDAGSETAPPLQTTPVKILRSSVAGHRPGDTHVRALTDGELFLNTTDKVLCYLNAAAALVTVSMDPTLYAMLASPALTGVPTAPTAALGTNSNQIATMAALQAAITALMNGAPGALDTLKELADAIGDDANDAATITTALGFRLRFDAAQTLTGTQKAQARANLGVESRTTVGNTNYVANSTDKVIAFTAALTAPRFLTLPAANSVNPGFILRIVDDAGGFSATNTLSISITGSDTLNGGTTKVLNSARAEISLISDGVSAWNTYYLGVGSGGSGSNTAAGARANYGAAASGANTDITSLGTLNGNLTISKARPAINLGATASGQAISIISNIGGNARWGFSLGDGTAEGGSNTGNSLAFFRYSDAGAFLGTSLSFNRATGVGTFEARPIWAGFTPYDTGNLTAAAIGSILTYTPARPVTVAEGGVATASGLPVGSGAAGIVGSVAFTATATSMFTIITGQSRCTTASGIEAATYYVELYDATTATVIGSGGGSLLYLRNEDSYTTWSCGLAQTGLVVGHSYSVRLRGYQTDNSYVVETTSAYIHVMNS